ncbi:MAG: ATPase domain-containing protein [Candidatus Bathyarchaeia archaeon]
MNLWIPTGCLFLDRALGGGLPPNEIALIYGEAETGKTSLAMQCAINAGRMGYKTLFVDSDGSLSPERLSQIASKDFARVSELIILVKPLSFDDQAAVVDNLEKYVGKKFGLIIFDTITSLYRSELDLDNKKETFRLNRELNRQVATLAQLAKSLEISILLTSQVSGVFEFGEADVKPVAKRVLKYWSNAVISLARMGQRNMVKATVEKSGGKEKKLTFYLIIEKDGVHDYNH